MRQALRLKGQICYWETRGERGEGRGCSGGPELRDGLGVGAGPIIVSVLAQIT